MRRMASETAAEKLGTVLPLRLFVSPQAKPCFMHESRSLKGLRTILPRHTSRGQLAQFLVDHRH